VRLDTGRPAIAMAAHNSLVAKLAAEASFDPIWGSAFELSASYAAPDANLLSVDTDSGADAGDRRFRRGLQWAPRCASIIHNSQHETDRDTTDAEAIVGIEQQNGAEYSGSKHSAIEAALSDPLKAGTISRK
jgi:hypothetical protein